MSTVVTTIYCPRAKDTAQPSVQDTSQDEISCLLCGLCMWISGIGLGTRNGKCSLCLEKSDQLQVQSVVSITYSVFKQSFCLVIE